MSILEIVLYTVIGSATLIYVIIKIVKFIKYKKNEAKVIEIADENCKKYQQEQEEIKKEQEYWRKQNENSRDAENM